MELALGWESSNNGTNGTLDMMGQVRGSMCFIDLDLLPSTLYFGRGNWSNPEVAHFTIDSSNVVVDTLVLYNGEQRVAMGGTLSKDPLKAIAFDLDQVRLENFAPLMRGPVVGGSLTGDGQLFDVYGTPYLSSYLCADSVVVRDRPVGDIKFNANWSERSGRHRFARGSHARPDQGLGLHG